MSMLRDQLETVIISLEAAGDVMRPGREWWQLTAAEEDVFGIERTRFPRMILTHHCYESFKGIADSPTWADASIEQARRQHPTWYGTHPSIKEFQCFAQIFGGLTLREAYAIFYKAEFWAQRSGIVSFADEARPK